MFKKNYDFIMREKDVTTVLSVINKHDLHALDGVGNCGWADEPDMWYIAFCTTEGKYRKIVKDLKAIGEFKADVGPRGQIDLMFVKAS